MKRGFYTIYEDPVIYASHIYYPSYISNWYVFQYYGTTTQLPKQLDVMTYRYDSIRNIKFINTNQIWGYKNIKYGDFEIFIADLEKAVIDAVVTDRVPMDEILTAIKNCDIKKLEKYTIKYNHSTIKRVGYLSEFAGFFLDEAFELIRHDRNYAYLPTFVEKNRWRVTSDRS